MAARLVDDGHRPELDLHGCSVDEAMALVRALITKAVGHGRNSVRIIHGASTSGTAQTRPTIKRALHRLLDSGELQLHIAGNWKESAYTIVALRHSSGPKHNRRLTLRDLN